MSERYNQDLLASVDWNSQSNPEKYPPLESIPEQQGLLEQSREAEEAEAEQQQARSAGGMSPGLASVLGAAGSMLRTSGWQSQPLSYAQRLGYAIPAGMQAYYQQGAYNQEAEEAYSTAEEAREKAESASEDREAFRQALVTSGLDPGWFPIFMGVYNNEAKDGWDKLKAKIEKNRKGPDVNYIPKEKLIEDNNPIAASIPDGGYLMKKKDGTEVPVGPDKQPLEKVKKDNFSAPEKIGDSWVMKNKETGDYKTISKIVQAKDPENTVQMMNGEQLHQYQILQGGAETTIPNPKQIFKVELTPLGAIADFEKQEFDPVSLGKEKRNLIGNWGINQKETLEVLQHTGLSLHPETASIRVTYTDKDGMVVEQYGEYSELLADRWKEKKLDERLQKRLDQDRDQFNEKMGVEASRYTDKLLKQVRDERLENDEAGRKAEIHKLRVEQLRRNLDKGYKYITKADFQNDPRYKDWVVDPRVRTVEVGPEGRVQFFDETMQPIEDLSTSTVKLLNEATGATHLWVVDEQGKAIKDLGVTEAKLETSVERLRFNQETADLKSKQASLDLLLADLKDDYNVPQKYLDNLNVRGKANIDSAIEDAEKRYEEERKRAGSLITGTNILRNNPGANVDKKKNYYWDGQKYAEHRPDQDTWNNQDAIRKDWNALTRDQRIAARGFNGVMSGLTHTDTGLGDIMAITSFRIMFEPNSVVRETEFKITELSQGYWKKIRMMYDKLTKGQKLHPDLREEMKRLVTTYMSAAEKTLQPQYNEYKQIANSRFGSDSMIIHPFGSYKWSPNYVNPDHLVNPGEDENSGSGDYTDTPGFEPAPGE